MPAATFREWFVGERARALAMVMLTRRDDLEIHETTGETGLDYLVHIKSGDAATPRVFGILIRATMSPITVEQANVQLKPTMKGLAAAEVFMPVCVFYFTVKTDQGYYTWGHEPVIEKGQAKLRPRAEPSCRPLDDAAIDAIISLVCAWYDGLSATLKL